MKLLNLLGKLNEKSSEEIATFLGVGFNNATESVVEQFKYRLSIIKEVNPEYLKYVKNDYFKILDRLKEILHLFK